MALSKPRSYCPVNMGLETFGDKWSLLIIRDMMFFGKQTYGEFLDSDESIATNILADRLLLLEKDGIITKEVNPENRTRFIYRLTEKGIGLLPLIVEMALWSNRFYADSKTDDFLKALAADKEGMIQKLSTALKRK